MGDLLGRFRPGDDGRHRFEAWPPAPPIRPAPAGKPGAAPALATSTDDWREPNKYGPGLVIGLGAAGEKVVRRWLTALAADPAGPQSRLRALLITDRPGPTPPAGTVPVRRLDLDSAAGAPLPARPRSRREEARLIFRQIAVYRPFRDYLRVCLQDLQRDIQVVIVGSLAERTIGLLGEVLQALRLSPAAVSNPFLNLTALLTLAPADAAEALEPAELYAAQREAGRFAFGGWHVMDPPAGDSDGVVRSALLDHLFVVDTHGPTPQAADLRHAPFEAGVGQAMAEAVFVLLHPSGRLLWENLANDLKQAGEARSRAHESLAHSLGIATLHLPLSEMQDYVAARLAHAALYGERPDRPDEGLIRQGNPAGGDPLAAEWLARRWLREGPCAHPLFDWLMALGSAADLRSVPALTAEFDAVFQAQLAHGITDLLNRPTEPDPLPQARAALHWLAGHLETVDGWFKSAPDARPGAPERLAFQALLNRWRSSLTHLTKQVEAWEKVLLPRQAAAREASPGSGRATPAADWRSQVAAVAVTGRAALPEEAAGLPVFLKQRRQAAEEALHAAASGSVCRALTADDQGGSSEAEAYYEDTVRPELSRHGLENSMAFQRVQDRLGWWVQLAPGRLPALYLICVPAGEAGSAWTDAPPVEWRFTSGEVERLGHAILAVARAQARTLADDLLGPWFNRRLKQHGGFLSQAAEPLLAYDQNAAARRPKAAAHRNYLIARNKSLTAERRRDAFPNAAENEINEFDGGDRTRLTALSLWLNLPLDTVLAVRGAYAHYRHREQLHLYPQERAAVRYERRIFDQTGRWQVLPPDLTLALADPPLVSLFCQAVIHGRIALQPDGLGQDLIWTVLPPAEDFTSLRLAPGGADALWPALWRFAVELPNRPDVNLNPADHFAAGLRAKFVAALWDSVRERMRAPEAREAREAFRATVLARCRERGEHDALQAALAELLSVELDEPVWEEE